MLSGKQAIAEQYLYCTKNIVYALYMQYIKTLIFRKKVH